MNEKERPFQSLTMVKKKDPYRGKALKGSFFFVNFNLEFIPERIRTSEGLYVDGISIAIVLDHGSTA